MQLEHTQREENNYYYFTSDRHLSTRSWSGNSTQEKCQVMLLILFLNKQWGERTFGEGWSLLKFRYSEKATKIWPIFHLWVHAFSEYLNFKSDLNFFHNYIILTSYYFDTSISYLVFINALPFYRSYLFWMVKNCFGRVQIRLFWNNFYNLDLSDIILNQPKQIRPF